MQENALDSVPPELATCYLENEYKQPAKSSRDMWSLGGIVLSMVTGSTLIDVLSDYFYQDAKSQHSMGSGMAHVYYWRYKLQYCHLPIAEQRAIC